MSLMVTGDKEEPLLSGDEGVVSPHLFPFSSLKCYVNRILK